MSDTLIVHTNSGPVRGGRHNGTKGTTYYSFLAIPYAKAPVGELRFKVSWFASVVQVLSQLSQR